MVYELRDYLSHGPEAANVAASTPFKKQVAQAATHKLVDTIVKSGKKNKIKVLIGHKKQNVKNIWKFKCSSFVNNELVAEAEVSAIINQN